jgi:hypothetical protein
VAATFPVAHCPKLLNTGTGPDVRLSEANNRPMVQVHGTVRTRAQQVVLEQYRSHLGSSAPGGLDSLPGWPRQRPLTRRAAKGTPLTFNSVEPRSLGEL